MRAAPLRTWRDEPGSVGEVLRVSIDRGIAALDEHAWDALLDDRDFYTSHAWLRGLDQALGACEVLGVHGPAGLLAGCPLWDGEANAGLLRLSEAFGDVAGPWERAFVWGGGRRSTHNELPCVRGRRRDAALRRLVEAMTGLARERDQAGAVWAYMPLAAAQELAEVCGASVLLHCAEANLAVPAGGMNGLIAGWNKHDRFEARAELAAFARCGNRIEWSVIDASNQDRVAELIASNRARHGSTQGPGWMQRVFDGQRRAGLLPAARLAMARRGQRIVGVCVLYRFGRVLHARYFGCDYQLTERDFRYFVLGCYAPVDYAARHGLSELRLSISALRAKARRGARIEPLAAAVMLTDGALDPGQVRRHNRAFAERLRDELAGHLDPAWQPFLH